jgi:cephalosporin hydroxylase
MNNYWDYTTNRPCGWINDYDFDALYDLSKSLNNNSVVVEIGTFLGRSTSFFIEKSPTIHCVDLWKTFELKQEWCDLEKLKSQNKNFPNVINTYEACKTNIGHRVTMIQGDSLAIDLSHLYGMCDLVFIDAGHTYNHVMSDLNLAKKLINDAGTISGHDWNDSFVDVKKSVLFFSRLNTKKLFVYPNSSVWKLL